MIPELDDLQLPVRYPIDKSMLKINPAGPVTGQCAAQRFLLSRTKTLPQMDMQISRMHFDFL